MEIEGIEREAFHPSSDRRRLRYRFTVRQHVCRLPKPLDISHFGGLPSYNLTPKLLRMLRRQQRLRREYLYRKSLEDQKRAVTERKEQVKRALEENQEIPTDLRRGALKLAAASEWDDEGGEYMTSHEDDEYRWAGVEDPKIVITTSRDPSSRLKMFAKEMKLIFPNSQRINRGNYEIKQLLDACRANDVTDFIMLRETRGVPDGMVVCHLPYGPTAYFQLMNTVMRHDIPDLGTMSEAYPHLIFHSMTSKLGQRVTNILKYLFPVPKPESRRVITFANSDDYISFRHHTYVKKPPAPGMNPNNHIELTEVGPRFEMRLYQIKLGTLDIENTCETEWVLRPYMNTAKKRKFLSAS